MGYRATAMAELPIGHETLIYGSDNGGDSVQKVSNLFLIQLSLFIIYFYFRLVMNSMVLLMCLESYGT